MEKTALTALIIGIFLAILALIRLFYALFIMKHLKRIRQCVDTGYQSVSKTFHIPKIRLQREEPIYQQPIQQTQIEQETNFDFDAAAKQFEAEMPQPQPIQQYQQPQQQVQQQPQQNNKRPYTINPNNYDVMVERAKKMREARVANRAKAQANAQQQALEQPQQTSEVDELKRRIRELGGNV